MEVILINIRDLTLQPTPVLTIIYLVSNFCRPVNISLLVFHTEFLQSSEIRILIFLIKVFAFK